MGGAAARAAIVLSIAIVSSVSAQKPGRSALDLGYSAIVHQYRAGDFEAAERTLAGRERSWVQDAVALVEATWRDRPTIDVEAAVMVHTGVAFTETVGPSDRDFHLRLARRLVDMDRGRRLPARFQRDWYLLAARSLRLRAEQADLLELVEAMTSRFPDDAGVLVEAGAAYELFAWSREPSSLPRSGTAYVGMAESAFRRALAAPDGRAENSDARLRLGRVLGLLERPAEALSTLEPLHAQPGSDRFRYLLLLFEGAASEGTGKPGAAAASYRQAAAIFPDCQTPWLALSEALSADGDTTGAADLVERASATEFRCDDPWWRYKLGEPSAVDTLLASLRREVTQ